MPLVQPLEWDKFLSHHPNAHLLQTTNWGNLKVSFGWEVMHFISQDGEIGAQVLFKRLSLGYSLAYIPKGPVGNLINSISWQSLLSEIDVICATKRCVLLKIEPDLYECDEETGRIPPPAGFQLSSHAIQPPRTILLDLSGDEAQLLAGMKQKTRYNLRLSKKRGVITRPSEDIALFYKLMQVTGQRDTFGIHNQDYYSKAYQLFYPCGECELFLAEYEHEPLAGLMVFMHGSRAWYFYGASTGEHRDVMPAYLLQWEAIHWARQQGCTQYDLWGVPDFDSEVLEKEFTQRSDGLWGVYRFKRGFGGCLSRSPGPWDRVYQPIHYRFYLWWVHRRGES